MLTEQQVSDAVVAFLNATGAHAFDLQDVPALPPDLYTEVTVTRRFGGTQRASGVREGVLWRVTTRQVARRLANAQTLRAKSAAMENVSLDVAGMTSTPVEFETSEPIGPDDGFFSGLESWTFALI